MHDITRISTIFTISNGIAKTPRDNYFIIEITALTSVGAVFLPRVILSLSNFSVVDPVCTLFDAALQFDFASLRSG